MQVKAKTACYVGRYYERGETFEWPHDGGLPPYCEALETPQTAPETEQEPAPEQEPEPEPAAAEEGGTETEGAAEAEGEAEEAEAGTGRKK